MSETKPENPQAFPTLEATHTRNADDALLSHQEHHVNPGMTLRDFFIAAALPEAMRQCAAMNDDPLTRGLGLHATLDTAGELACKAADAALRAREAK